MSRAPKKPVDRLHQAAMRMADDWHMNTMSDVKDSDRAFRRLASKLLREAFNAGRTKLRRQGPPSAAVLPHEESA